nr:uncharacterized protein LOC108061821 [Drosophila takahashii]XP_017003712.2 uncharacterized protein LOC108061821 [Drosophila takahashii]XP_017003713.2 uncharacterized protein LOC108061821 [Drosophila takahashii]XP_044249957.1 uncharacterized protein LOC108061821 [Drosophila takahashii]
MDENGACTLNSDCILEIIKYIITDCEAYDTSSYNDLINFVLAHELFLELLATHYKTLYNELEVAVACRISRLLIDLRINKLSSQNRDLFWSSHLHSIKNRLPFNVDLNFHNEMVCNSNVETKGPLSCSAIMKLNVNITPEALGDICRSLPSLRKLFFESTVLMNGSISKIVPHCKNLEKLSIELRPGSDVAQFAPLTQLPSLRTLNISGIHKSGSQLVFFNDLIRWHRPQNLPPLRLSIRDDICERYITFAALETLLYLRIHDHSETKSSTYHISFEAEYEFNEVTQGGSTEEESLVTTTFGNNMNMVFNSCREELVLMITKNSDIGKVSFLSRLRKLRSLVIKKLNGGFIEQHTSIAKFLRSLVPNESLALTSCKISDICLDRSESIELAKIKSLRFLKCYLSDCSSLQFLNQLTNLQYLEINVNDSLVSNTSFFVLNLLSTCQMHAKINCKNFEITLRNYEKTLNIFMKYDCPADILSPLAQLNGVTSLQISGQTESKSLNRFLEAFANSKISSIEELDISKLSIYVNSLNSISKVLSYFKIIKKHPRPLRDLHGIDPLEELNINTNELGTLSLLFSSLAAKNVIQSIKIASVELLPEEVSRVSRITSLKKLECSFAELQDQNSLSQLASSKIKDLIVFVNQNQSLMTLLTAFSSKNTIALQRLEIVGKTLDISEQTEISKLTVLKSLKISSIHLVPSPLCNLQNLELPFNIGFSECKLLVELETLQSLKCSLRVEKGIEVLATIQSLKELIIDKADGSLVEFFRAFAHENLESLQILHIISSDEIHELSQIKSLAVLNIIINRECDNLSEIGQLTELKSLRIAEENWFGICQLSTAAKDTFFASNEADKYNFFASNEAEKDTFFASNDCVLHIFRKCEKLDHVTLEFNEGFMKLENISQEIYKILRSKRDSELRTPLKLFIQSYDHVEDIENEYLIVSSKQIYNYTHPYEINTNCWGGGSCSLYY